MKKLFVFSILSSTFLLSEITVSKSNGGSIVIDLGYDIKLNEGSLIEREWHTINNSKIPLEIVGDAGINIIYQSRNYSGDYLYKTIFNVLPKDDISAFEIIFITFNLWGEKTNNLVMTEVNEFINGMPKTIDASWKIFSENNASEFHTSLSYVSKVRLKNGKIIRANPSEIVKVAQNIADTFTKDDLKIKKD
tara:strand:+ start:546 stop:1121 length:576 start_codon:yes stop_codon:yes gene_type:complete